MRRTPACSLAFALLLACKGGDPSGTESATDPGSTTSDDPTTGVTSTTGDDPTTGSEGTQSTTDSPTSEPDTGTTSGEPGCEDADGDGFGVGCAGGEDCDDGSDRCAQDCIDVDDNGLPECAEAPGTGVLLFTGSMGGGPETDLYVDVLASMYIDAGHDTMIANSFPGTFAQTTGTMLILNPLEPLGQKVLLGARYLLLRGGRVVLIMEHCKNGCYGNAAEDNAFLEALGSSIRLSGEGGAPLAETPLTLAAAPPTEGLSSIVTYYSGSLTVGDGLALGTMDGGAGDVVLGYETLYNGDIVVAADSSIFGFMLDAGDNTAFVVGLADTVLGGP
jgi:hypothetical protein